MPFKCSPSIQHNNIILPTLVWSLIFSVSEFQTVYGSAILDTYLQNLTSFWVSVQYVVDLLGQRWCLSSNFIIAITVTTAFSERTGFCGIIKLCTSTGSKYLIIVITLGTCEGLRTLKMVLLSCRQLKGKKVLSMWSCGRPVMPLRINLAAHSWHLWCLFETWYIDFRA